MEQEIRDLPGDPLDNGMEEKGKGQWTHLLDTAATEDGVRTKEEMRMNRIAILKPMGEQRDRSPNLPEHDLTINAVKSI